MAVAQKVLKRAKQKLLDERERLREQLEEIEDSVRIDRWEDARADLVDAGSAAAERQQSALEAGEFRERLTSVEDALRRIDDGEYGVCEICDEKIPTERLEVLPATARCVEHAGVRR